MRDRIDFLILRVIEDVRLNWPSVAGSVLAGALCMMLVGSAFIASWSVNRGFPEWLREGGAAAYLLPGVPPERQSQLAAEISDWPEIDSARVVSAEEAWRRLQRDFGVWKDAFRGFSSSPLPASIEATFKGSVSDWTGREVVLNKIRRLPEVEDVAPGGDIYEETGRFLGFVRRMAAGLLVLAASALVSVAFCASGHAVAARREELEVYHCVGATRAFIGGPYYAGGALQGAASALVAFFALLAGIATVSSVQASSLNVLLSWRLSDSFLLFCWLFGWGGGMGCLGSWLALRRFFKRCGKGSL